MIITPFAFYKQVAAGWTPAELTDILYWFNTGQGVTESGGVVSAWTDAISGRTLSVGAGTGMTYTATDSVVNNQPSIYNDGTKATLVNTSLTGDVTNGDVYTQIWIGKPDVVGSNTYAIWGGNTSTAAASCELAPYISSPDAADVPGYYRFAIGGAGRTNITGTTNNGELAFHIEAFDTPNGIIYQYWNSTTPLQSTNWGVSSVDRDPFRFEIGGYSNALQFKGRIMECIVMKAIPTEEELQLLNAYIQTKYAGYTIPTDGLIAWYDAADYSSGATWIDRSGNNNDLTLTGTYSKSAISIGGPSLLLNSAYGVKTGVTGWASTTDVTHIEIQKLVGSPTSFQASWGVEGTNALSGFQFGGAGDIAAWVTGKTGWFLNVAGRKYSNVTNVFAAKRVTSGFDNTSGLTISYGDSSAVGLTHYGAGNFIIYRTPTDTTYSIGASATLRVATPETNLTYDMPGYYGVNLFYNRILTDAEIEEIYNYYKPIYNLI